MKHSLCPPHTIQVHLSPLPCGTHPPKFGLFEGAKWVILLHVVRHTNAHYTQIPPTQTQRDRPESIFEVNFEK